MSPLSHFLELLLLGTSSYGMGYPFGQFRSAVVVCLLCPEAPVTDSAVPEVETSLVLYNTAQQEQKHVVVTLFSPKAKT